MKKGLILFFLIIIIFAILFFKNDKETIPAGEEASKKSEPEVIRVVSLPDLDQINFFLDYLGDKGFLERSNIDLERVFVDRGTDNVVLAGGADIRIGRLGGTLALYLENQDTRWVDSLFNSFNTLGVSRYSKQEIGLVKKAVVSKTSGSSMLLVSTALKSMGADLENIEFVAVPTNIGKKEFLDRGGADFTVLGSRDFIEETEMDKDYYIFETNEIYDRANMFYVITSIAEVMEEKGEAIEKLVLAGEEALNEIKAEKEDVIVYLMEKYDYSEDKAEIFYERLNSSMENIPPPNIETAQEIKNQFRDAFDPENPDRDLTDFVVSY